MIWTIAKKELRGYFNSAIALVFLGGFLATVIFSFFWADKFFARGVADLRLMFAWMPRLMILLVSALAMRLWAEERRAGTLEVLLTLPIERWRLVAGKFLGGMLLIGLALALTLGLPLTVAQMGRVDLGPILGGYLACLLLAAAYLAIALCVSAATDNEIVAFIGTLLVCLLMYALGAAPEPLAQLGTGVRFESVARGVLDLRDLAYYGGIVATGVAINVLLLQRVSWASGPAGAKRRRGMALAVVLVAANAIALVAWTQPVRALRLDITRDKTFSLSAGTAKVLSTLDEPLLIRGYFSEKLPAELAVLTPQIRDLLEEYAAQGKGRVRVEIVDPSDSDDKKREAKERFGIDPQPLRFATQNEQSVVNAYLSIGLAYGDQTEVIGFDELIRWRMIDLGKVEFGLKNVEYAVTRTIKKAVASFSSVDTMFATTTGKVELTAYVTAKALPENWKDAPAKLEKVVAKLSKQAGGKLVFTQIEPKTDEEKLQLFRSWGIRPYVDAVTEQPYYFHLLMKVGDRMVRIQPPEALGEAELEATLVDGLERAAPGFTRVVGLWQPPSMGNVPGMQGAPPQPLPPPQAFRLLSESLARNYEVRPVQLTAPIPNDIDTLVLGGPANLDAKAAAYIDQYVMGGGNLVLLAGRYRLAPSQGIAIEKIDTGLETMLAKWGITLGDQMVLDTKNDSFPMPQERDVGNGQMVREVAQLAYPFFVKVEGIQLADSLVTNGLVGSIQHWAVPVTAAATVDEDKHAVVNLLVSSGESWLSSSTVVDPDLRKYPGSGFPPAPTDAKRGAQVLAVAVKGGFASAFTKQHSALDARIVVFGSSAFASDDILNLSRQLDSQLGISNLELVHNAVDWSLADEDLLSIRSRNSAAHAITLPVEERAKWPFINALIAALGLAGVVGFAYLRRRGVTPIVTATVGKA